MILMCMQNGIFLDGLAGTIKRLARRASLQVGTRQQILTPLALFD